MRTGWTFFGMLMGSALAHTGRAVTDPTLPLWAKALLVVGAVVSMVLLVQGATRILNSAGMGAGKHTVRKRGLTQVLVSGVAFTLLMFYMVQTPQTVPSGTVLVLQEQGEWEAHYPDGRHMEGEVRLPVGQLSTLRLKSEKDTTLQVQQLGISIELPAGEETQLALVLPARQSFATSEPGLVLKGE